MKSGVSNLIHFNNEGQLFKKLYLPKLKNKNVTFTEIYETMFYQYLENKWLSFER